MKSASALILALLSGVLAYPASTFTLITRQSIETVTDELLFSDTLPEFTTHRNDLDPSTLDWTSDGCTTSPDNPFGFPFVPGCNRHDFGYQNYRAQTRFTESAKLAIDQNLKADLYYQCESTSTVTVCKGLADVYYAAVREFGGGDATPGKKAIDGNTEYDNAVAIYNTLVADAQAKGELPVL
jgi:hypothetical protein